MNQNNLRVACAMALAFSVPCSAQDLAVTAGSQAKVVLDNARVRVVQLEIPPGGKTGMHSHGDNLVVYLTDGDAIQTLADGSSKSRHTTAGEVLWSDPVTHDTRNTGKAPVKVVVIELKEPAK
ncbi:cupin domain-containing protein [Pseudoxanthomonas gei]|uniref:Cupin domain-containing protein n=1 Tax=Pseudoxanthomonas gei TaxID=1383030 RepID=A0ABX0ACJ4_9GAMM|nr:cupin domain-containing protein [Pseudoxanthomonas gei]NDK37890.1 cupin domain-containing protein [Pseudoxanthomonas gei]